MSLNSVFLKEMPFVICIGKDAWQREKKPQPVNITLRVDHVDSTIDAAASDDVSKCLDYGKLYKSIQRKLQSQTDYSNFRQIAIDVIIIPPHLSASVQVDLPKAALRAEDGLRYTLSAEYKADSKKLSESLDIRGVRCPCIIGVNPHERRDRQIVIVNMTFKSCSMDGSLDDLRASATAALAMDRYHEIIETVTRRVEGSSYQTVEALANALCRDVTMQFDIPEIEVSVEKPYAIPSIGAAGVCIHRRRSFYEKSGFGKE